MKEPTLTRHKKFGNLLNHLSELSVEQYYNPYKTFVWPERLPRDSYWMSPDLISLVGTPRWEELDQQQRWRLSQCEAVNFFSFNVHGIKGLLAHALSVIHTTEFEDISEYLHHFIGEENEHMWFFAQFCNRYGGKIYALPQLNFQGFEEPDIDHFVAFAKMLLAEQIGDYYNLFMKDDASLHPLVRQINRIHHEDESRHISMGRKIVKVLHEELVGKYSPKRLQEVEDYLRRYMMFLLESFYNPRAYRDAGLAEPYELRRQLLQHPARIAFHKQVLRNSNHFLKANHIFQHDIL